MTTKDPDKNLSQHPIADDSELVEVLASIDPTQTRIARDMLESAGIEGFVFDSQSSRMLGTTPGIPTRLMVRHEDAEEARKRLKELGLLE